VKLRILLPTEVLVEADDVRRIGFEDEDGAMTLLENALDLATAVAPGVLSYELAGGAERFAAVAEGVLVKVGSEVLVSTRKGVLGDALGELRERVEAEFLQLDEVERATRTALAEMEATFVHRFIELEHG
jgi:F-type H+-transporting ATPase subunit epsilon